MDGATVNGAERNVPLAGTTARSNSNQPWLEFGLLVDEDHPQDEWSLPGPKQLHEEIAKQYSEDQKAKAWSDAAEAVKTYSDEMINRWSREMDTLLVYAGLFSAVLTAFNVQSYQSLQSSSTDTTNALLRRISTQLDSFSINPSFVNSTRQSTSFDDARPPFRAPASAVWINALWFSSLVCSLAAASIALMVKQWLHELESGVSGSSRETGRRRQYRLDGILKWRVGAIVVVIPILLQLALVLFLAGLIILLWTLHGTVAAIATSLVGALFIFQFTVTILPSYHLDCCFLSPQALAIYSVVRPLHNTTLALLQHLSRLWTRSERPSFWHSDASDLSTLRALKKRIISFCNSRREMPPWRGQEHLVIASARTSSALDRRMAIMACKTTFTFEHLEDVEVIFSSLSPNEVAGYVRDVWDLYKRRQATGLASYQVTRSVMHLLLHALRHMLTVGPDARDEEWERTVKWIVEHHSPLPTFQPTSMDLQLTTFSILATHDSVAGSLALSKVRYHTGLKWSCSYSTIRNVMVMAELQMQRHRNIGEDPSASLYTYLQAFQIAIRGIVLVVSENSPVTPPPTSAQVDTILSHARDILVSFESLLRSQHWEGLQDTMPDEWKHSGPFLHFLSLWLEQFAILPLTTLANRSRHSKLVTEGLLEALEDAWARAQAGYPPQSAPPETGQTRVPSNSASAMGRIERELETLRAYVVYQRTFQ
ncbi:hypothetical protein BD311DRAFT_351394 [Dichomitus squalens]|uniref:DUF6535 domain-containing protein n=1 Tax=Dichomitus squalens TaxID=114155 RepID=A0A4Q9N505_9APHY|nr:hypothetical protein BD311DRAFT_351394 [Dichomitus squalens]